MKSSAQSPRRGRIKLLRVLTFYAGGLALGICLAMCASGIGLRGIGAGMKPEKTESLEQSLIDDQPLLEKIAAWAKTNFASPSVDSDVKLPAAFPAPAEGRRIQIILLPSGQVVVLVTLYTESSLSDGGPALVYVTLPLTSKQLGLNDAGQKVIHIQGIWEHHVEKQLSPQLHSVELKHDPD